MLSSGWESTFDSIVLLDAEGNIKDIYPRKASPAINLHEHFKVLEKNKNNI